MNKGKVGIMMVFMLLVEAFSSPWTLPKGQVFISPYYSYYQTSSYFDSSGHLKPMGCTYKQNYYSVYGEYGLNNNTTLNFDIPYEDISCGSNHSSGVSDVKLGFVRHIAGSKNVVSFYGTAIIPSGYSIDKNLRLGYGRPGLEAGVLYGTSSNIGYMDGGLGYRYYVGYPSDQVRGYLEGAYNLYKYIQMYGLLDAQIGVGNGRTKQVGQNILAEPNYKLIQVYIGPRFVIKNNFSFVIGVQKPLWGENTGDGAGAFGSIWYQF